MMGEAEQAYRRALFLLERRDYTEHELHTKLKDKGFSEESISLTISKLKEYNLIDDKRFTEQYLRFHYEKYSKRMLAVKLLRKGICSELFDSVYNDIYSEINRNPEDEALENAIASALRKAERKGYSVSNLPPEEERRIISSLYRKGFSIGRINSVLNRKTESDL